MANKLGWVSILKYGLSSRITTLEMVLIDVEKTGSIGHRMEVRYGKTGQGHAPDSCHAVAPQPVHHLDRLPVPAVAQRWFAFLCLSILVKFFYLVRV